MPNLFRLAHEVRSVATILLLCIVPSLPPQQVEKWLLKDTTTGTLHYLKKPQRMALVDQRGGGVHANRRLLLPLLLKSHKKEGGGRLKVGRTTSKGNTPKSGVHTGLALTHVGDDASNNVPLTQCYSWFCFCTVQALWGPLVISPWHLPKTPITNCKQ